MGWQRLERALEHVALVRSVPCSSLPGPYALRKYCFHLQLLPKDRDHSRRSLFLRRVPKRSGDDALQRRREPEAPALTLLLLLPRPPNCPKRLG